MQKKIRSRNAVCCALLTLFLFGGTAYGLSEQEMTQEQRSAMLGDWKPLRVKGDAIPWNIFAETKEISKKRIFPDGGYTFDISPQYGEAIKKLDGKEVTLMGFMFPLEQSENQKNFLIGPYPLTCPFHYHVGPTQTVEVLAKEPFDFSYDPITIKGTLSVRFNKETGVFYYLENAHK